MNNWGIQDVIAAMFIFGSPILITIFFISYLSMKDGLSIGAFFKKFYMRSEDPVENFKLYAFQLSYYLLVAIGLIFFGTAGMWG